jgi:hypothetical protein
VGDKFLSDEEPKIEMVTSSDMYTLELCNPIKEQINKITICGPNIDIKACNPIAQVRCIPDIRCLPIVAPVKRIICNPTCNPVIQLEKEPTICAPADRRQGWRDFEIYVRPTWDFVVSVNNQIAQLNQEILKLRADIEKKMR